MKKEYEAPKAEKIEFNYCETVVASNGGACTRQNDNGNGNGCLKPGHAQYNDVV